jgi:inorganic phosphate transporter, PiT family
MLASMAPGAAPALAFLIICLALVLAFEFTNGFHDSANAVATVIYTHSLTPVQAVIWSGLMNFLGVLLGGIAVAYTLVDIMPPAVLSPPDGNPAIPLLLSLTFGALVWNLATWWFALPNSSSHCLIGSLIGVSIAAAIQTGAGIEQGVDWGQIAKVIKALAFSPLAGFVGALLLFRLIRLLFKDHHLYEPPTHGRPPVWWMRGILILTCTGVSFTHGSNDGQKSIGLIMLVVIGLAPATFALDPAMTQAQRAALSAPAHEAAALIARYSGPDAARVETSATTLATALAQPIAPAQRAEVRREVITVRGALKQISEGHGGAPAAAQTEAKTLGKQLGKLTEFAPWWVRLLSAACLGIGTMIGYQRIVKTLGEGIGKTHLVPAQGGAAELVAAVVIGTAGYTGAPVSTTHIVTSGIAGTMVGAGTKLNWSMVARIAAAWILTLPATIVLSGALFLLLARVS